MAVQKYTVNINGKVSTYDNLPDALAALEAAGESSTTHDSRGRWVITVPEVPTPGTVPLRLVITVEEPVIRRGRWVITVGVEDRVKEGFWTSMGQFTLDSSDWATLAKVPGDYNGYIAGLTLHGYTEVMVVGKSGAWNDGGEDPSWRGFCCVVTEIDFTLLGPFDSYDTEQEAEDEFQASPVILYLGDDKQVWWGIDDIVGKNTGSLTIEVFAR